MSPSKPEWMVVDPYETPPPVTETCPHGLANVSYHPCRFCLEERLDAILKLLEELRK